MLPIELIKKGGKVDLTAYIPKGALPNGVDMGEFVISPSNPLGEYKIEHTLGVVPNVILIYRDDKSDELVNGIVRAVVKLNVGLDYDEELQQNVPYYEVMRSFYDTATSITQTTGTTPDVDTDKYFYVPKVGTRVYMPAETYKWIAIAYGG